jgi:hypothetical protein
MSSRKPKQDLEHLYDLSSERLQLIEVGPNKKPESVSLTKRPSMPIVVVQLADSTKPRTLH